MLLSGASRDLHAYFNGPHTDLNKWHERPDFLTTAVIQQYIEDYVGPAYYRILPSVCTRPRVALYHTKMR